MYPPCSQWFFGVSQRLSKGCDRGGYYHELFLRGRPNLCRRIVRTTIKGRSQKDSGSSSITNAAVTSTMSEPNFYSMVHCYDTHSNDINMEPQHATVSSNLHNIEKAKMRPSASCEASSNSIEDAFNAESIKRQLHDKECHPAYLFPPVNAIFSTEPLPYHSCHGVVSSETIGVRQEQLKWSSSDPAYTMFSSDNFTSECPPYIAEQLLQGAASILLQIEAPDLRACYSQGSHFGNKTNVHQPRVGQNSDPSCSLFPTNIVVTPTPSPQHRRSVITTVGGTRPQLKHPNGVAVATGNESLLEDSAFPSPCCDKQMRCSEKLSLVSLLTPFAMAAFQNHSKGEVDDDQDWTRQVASDECFVFDDEDEMSTFGSLSVSSGF